MATYRVLFLEFEKGWGSKVEYSEPYDDIQDAIRVYQANQPTGNETPDYYYISIGIEKGLASVTEDTIWNDITAFVNKEKKNERIKE